jgi:hypothetical protein
MESLVFNKDENGSFWNYEHGKTHTAICGELLYIKIQWVDLNTCQYNLVSVLHSIQALIFMGEEAIFLSWIDDENQIQL